MTCKNLGIDPFAYLRDVLDRISTHRNSRLNQLLPDQWKKLRGNRRDDGSRGLNPTARQSAATRPGS